MYLVGLALLSSSLLLLLGLGNGGITLGLAIGRFEEAPRRLAMQTCGVASALIGAGLTISLV